MILAGGGSGNSDYLLPVARKKLEETDCILASPRFAALFPGQEVQPMGKISQLLEQLPELSGCMFLPGDQPLLRRETVEAMTALFCREQPSPAEWQKGTEREIFRLGAVAENGPAPLVGSPVLFGSSFFPELLTLPENKGGNILLKKYPAQVRTVCIADSAELLDADTPEVLQQLEALARQKN